MSAIQPFLANALYNHLFRGISFASPSNLYIALFTGGIEVAGGAYARQPYQGSTNWTAPVNGGGTNVNAISWTAASAPWGTVDHYGIYDASSGGNLYIFDALQTAKVIGTGDQFILPVGAIAESFQ